MEVTYGLKSILIADDPLEITPVDLFAPFYESEMMAMPVISGIDQIFKMETSASVDIGSIDINPKIMRMLFGNHWNKPVKSKVYRLKFRNKAYSRPVYVYQPFSRVASKKELQITKRLIKKSWDRIA